MTGRYSSSLFRAGVALGFVLVLAGCTKGGQFDPTELFNNDMFDTKTKLKGERVPLFPNGVPGTTTGVPADLVKGYQPPPDQANLNPDAIDAPPADAGKLEAKPKPKPKPKVAVARPPKRTANQKPPSSTPTRIDIGAKTGTPAQQPQPAQPAGQFAWPAPPTESTQQAAQPSQFAWPAPPQTAPAQQTAQPSQSISPNPPPTGTSSQ